MSDSKLPLENAKSFVHNAFSLLSSGSNPSSSVSSVAASSNPAQSKTNPTSIESTPEDIPKDDLVHLCMKMNKRMQAMEAKGQELIKKKNALANDKKILVDFLKSIPLHVSFQGDEELTVEVLSEAWRQYSSQQHDHVSALESKVAMTEHSLSQLEAKYRQELLQMQTIKPANLEDSDNNVGSNHLNAEIERLLHEKEAMDVIVLDLQTRIRKQESDIESRRAVELSLRNSIQSLEENLAAKREKVEDLSRSLESSRANFEEKILFFQMQQNSWKQKEETSLREAAELKKQVETLQSQHAALLVKIDEKDMMLKTGRDLTQSLQLRLVVLESEFNEKQSSNRDLEKMQLNLNQLLRDKEDMSKRLKELEEYRARTEGLIAKVSNQSEQINVLKSEVEDKVSLLTRLRAEGQANERNHAMRTAMLATCEAQLEALNHTLSSKDATIQEATDRITSLQVRLASSEDRFQERLNELSSKIEALETVNTEQQQKYEEEMTAAKIQFEESSEGLRRDFAKKSSLARSLISEKEEENRLLVAKVQELQAEIASGAPTERKIFELAQAQARRENFQSQHGDTREIIFQKIQSTLADKDLEFARLQQTLSETNIEIAELRRISRRETVNMDYLKNVILQYMTFPISAPERMSLVPVIAMLLQFNPKELVEVEKSSKDPNSSSRPVKEIKRSLIRASVSVPSLSPAPLRVGSVASYKSDGTMSQEPSPRSAELAVAAALNNN